jgi:hypothetical protein
MTRRRFLLLLVAAVCALGLAAWWAARSQTALEWVAARLEAFTDGRLRIESPSGSLASTIRAWCTPTRTCA